MKPTDGKKRAKIIYTKFLISFVVFVLVVMFSILQNYLARSFGLMKERKKRIGFFAKNAIRGHVFIIRFNISLSSFFSRRFTKFVKENIVCLSFGFSVELV